MEFLHVLHEHQPARDLHSPLSPREYTVLYLLAWGYTNKEVANYLNISVKTVEAHKAGGFRKLNLSSRAALVRYAVDHDWVRNNALKN